MDVTLKFDRVRVDTPGWAWVIGTLRSRKLVADTDRLHVTLEGGTSDGGVDPSLGDLGPFGTDTASPFEAEGCMRDTMWLRSELVDMGLNPGPTTLDFDYRVDGNKLESRITLETPGVSKVSLLRHEILPGKINPYLLDLTQTATTDERWLVEDAGFVKARNAFCAKRDGTTEADFVLRHVAAVKRLLEIGGLALDEDTLAAYAGFARLGGEFSFGGSYAMPLPSDIYYEARDTGQAFTRMNAILEREKSKTAVRISRVPPRPLPGLEDLATYGAMVKEQGGVTPLTAAIAAPEGAQVCSSCGGGACCEPVGDHGRERTSARGRDALSFHSGRSSAIHSAGETRRRVGLEGPRQVCRPRHRNHDSAYADADGHDPGRRPQRGHRRGQRAGWACEEPDPPGWLHPGGVDSLRRIS